MSVRVEREGRAAQFYICFRLHHIHLILCKRSIALNTYLYAFIILRYNFANISAIESKPHPIFRYTKMATKVRLRIEEIR